ncbi:conjugal transfer protein TraG N-terminal domain-containing protein [Halomonas sp. 86]|uniref:conjugal transfer protein TraG N-terminal domain-containing protein n=1 Tax=unclassified Halomonas TaxID=2609666 RepID=UPI004034B0C2
MYTIYSIGDSAFLEQILIAVSMVTGTGSFSGMVKSGLLLGFLLIAFQSLFRGGQTIPFQQILVCWIIYACFFGPSADLMIEDAYTGEARIVANVPLGIAGAGSIISNVGYHITVLFETGYGVITPSVTSTYFADSLKLLNEVRKSASDAAVFKAMNDAIGPAADLRASLDNYIKECTLVKMDRGEVSADRLFTGNTIQELRFDSPVFGTQIFDGTPGGMHVNCSEAFNLLSGMLNQVTLPGVQDAIAAVTKANGLPTNVMANISDATHALGMGMTHAQDFVKLSIIEPVYHEAVSGKYSDFRDFTSSMMVNQAIQQRNTQWAAEASMFMSIVRPMLTFIEGFVYAITPFMGFLIVLGGFGIQLASKYGQILLWTQLWMPVLAIINLFIHMGATRELASYTMNAGGINSFYALSRSSDILENWIGTGGMLAAATPILTLVLVTGSTYALTSLAGRMQGGEHLNEKMATPDSAANSEVLKNMPQNVNDPTMGQRGFGAEQAIGSLAMGTQAQQAVSSSEQNMQSASQSFQKSLRSAIQSTAGTSSAQSFNHGIAASVASSGASGSSAMSSASMQLASNLGYSGSEQVSAAESIQAQLMGGGGLSLRAGKGASLGGQFGGEVKSSSAEGNTKTFEMSEAQAQSFLQSNGISSSNVAEMRNSLAEDIQSRSSDEIRSGWGVSNSEDLSQAASELTQTTETYAKVSSLSQGFSVNDNFSLATLGNNLTDTRTEGRREARAMLEESSQWFSSDQKEAVTNRVSELTESLNFEEEQAEQIARLEVMSNRNNFSNDDDYLRSTSQVMEIVGKAVGKSYFDAEASSYNPHQNAELAEQAPQINGELTSEVGSRITPPAPAGQNGERSFSELQAGSQRGIDADRGQVAAFASAPPSAELGSHHSTQQGNVTAADQKAVSDTARAARDQAGQNINNIGQELTQGEPSAANNMLNSFTGKAFPVDEQDYQADLWMARDLTPEQRQAYVDAIDNNEMTMSDVLGDYSGWSMFGGGPQDANPEVAEAILRLETGDTEHLNTAEPGVRQAVSDILSNRNHLQHGSSSTGTYGAAFEPPSGEKIYQANFERFANENPDAPAPMVGIMAASYMQEGSERDFYMNQHREELAEEVRQIEPDSSPADITQRVHNMEAIAIDTAINPNGPDIGLAHTQNYYDNAVRMDTGEREVEGAGPAEYRNLNYQVPNSHSGVAEPRTTNEPIPQSNNDAPTHGSMPPVPLEVPPPSDHQAPDRAPTQGSIPPAPLAVPPSSEHQAPDRASSAPEPLTVPPSGGFMSSVETTAPISGPLTKPDESSPLTNAPLMASTEPTYGDDPFAQDSQPPPAKPKGNPHESSVESDKAPKRRAPSKPENLS